MFSWFSLGGLCVCTNLPFFKLSNWASRLLAVAVCGPLYSCAISCNSLSSLILFIESSLSVLVNLAHVLPINSSSVSLMASVSLSALVSGASLLWALFVLFWLLEGQDGPNSANISSGT